MKPQRALEQGFLGHLARRLDVAEPVLQRRRPSRYEPVRPWSGDALAPADSVPALRAPAASAAPTAAAWQTHERHAPVRQAAVIDAEPLAPRSEPAPRRANSAAPRTAQAMPRTGEAPLPPPARPSIADSIADSVDTPRARPTRATATSIEEVAQPAPLANRPAAPPVQATTPAR
ncbi:MAG: hypothetical protein KGO01_13535, partial [Burkholderiales bacterium]|nr:hypothetical protein [Burkholderiales bacterium]